MEATSVTPQTLAEVEEKVFREAMDRGLADLPEFASWLTD